MINLIGAIVSFVIVYFAIPPIMKLAKKSEFTDKPTKRKKHRGPIPLSGGIAIYFGFFVSYFGILIYTKGKGLITDFNQPFWIFVSSTMVLLIGLVDDYYKSKRKEFPIYPRFIVQILAAILVYRAGVVFQGLDNPFTGTYLYLPEWIQFLLTITWIFGVTTVINWSDGMDGLAGGISVISALTFYFAAVILGQNYSAFMSLLLAGSVAGFFLHNKYPAKVFMGDSGANMIGFLLAIIALDGAFKQATVLSVFIPILALAVPIFDNIFVIFKRLFEGKPIYQADRSQMHFRLSEKGFTVNQVVTFILGISLLFSLICIGLLLYKR